MARQGYVNGNRNLMNPFGLAPNLETDIERANHKIMELEEILKHENYMKMELEEKIKQVTLKINKLNSYKTSCGNCDADDAESSHPDDTLDAMILQEIKELKEKKTCRVCRSNDICILLLPCRHLCLCKDCEVRVDACPLCGSLKNASVHVYTPW